jgi:hypothetical protein
VLGNAIGDHFAGVALVGEGMSVALSGRPILNGVKHVDRETVGSVGDSIFFAYIYIGLTSHLRVHKPS